MPRIFDNIEASLLPALRDTMEISARGDFCVGYFNLRGWRTIADLVERWTPGDREPCRLLIGMQRTAQEQLRKALSLSNEADGLDNQTAEKLRRQLAEEFRQQLSFGAPTNSDEAGLRQLSAQLKSGKVRVRLFLRHQLHAKLYLLYRSDPNNPITSFLGSSNLTFSGLSHQGELNVDVLDHDATSKLAKWFEDRWADRWCIDISEDLIRVIDESWAREEALQPYLIYVKMAYHLAQEARAGLSEFKIPDEFEDRLFAYQEAAVKIAAHHLNRRGGVLIGDVVGLGKTLMATALARVFQDDHFTETLIICPLNLVGMWEDHVQEYRLIARVLPITRVIRDLPELRRYRVVIIDESHNLRNREGRRYRAIQEYLAENESRCILLSATPYNKTYSDLANQLRLFVPEERDIGVRPERLLRDIGEKEFVRQYQCPVRSITAFEKSEYADDWRDLMRLYMVRRTRSFIQNNYAETDELGRKYLLLSDGSRSYFPLRQPRTLKFVVSDADPADQYARLYSPTVVDAINALHLPRYGLGNYVNARPKRTPSEAERSQLNDLSRAGKRLMGFCRTNLFKRLESSGFAFEQSMKRHLLRNCVFLHAIENDLPLPLGAQDAGLLDAGNNDEDIDGQTPQAALALEGESAVGPVSAVSDASLTDLTLKRQAAETYERYATDHHSQFRWLRADLFTAQLRKDLVSDNGRLSKILFEMGAWSADRDSKLSRLVELLTVQHKDAKVLVFSQFADTVRYIERELARRNVPSCAAVTGDTSDPTSFAWRFSPISNRKQNSVSAEKELRVLVVTDVLSEGQNLQDGAILVNYDLPWAIIRLIQRAGRIDRIGQRAEKILCYSFLPEEGVERIIQLRARVRQRLRQNAEVVGTDERFFEDEDEGQELVDLYNENAAVLDEDGDTEVDLASYAYQIWKNAVDRDERIQRVIPELPNVAYASKAHLEREGKPPGVLVYLKTAQNNDALAWIDSDGRNVTQSQFDILRAAACEPRAPIVPRRSDHHDLVAKGMSHIAEEERQVGGQLGRKAGARYRAYERLMRYATAVQNTLFDLPDLAKAIEEIYRFPLRQSAIDTLSRQMKAGIDDAQLADLVLALREDGRLCQVQDADEQSDPQIICSLGLVGGDPP